jgi:serine/threonine-protein kinase
MIGTTLNNFRIVEKIGAGGQGAVYKAVDSKLGRTVVIKVLPAELTARAANLKRFEREARLCSSLDHPNICTIFDLGEVHGINFIAMQYIEGKNVRQLVNGRPLEVRSALSIAIQVADALAAAHARGIIHRDIKAGNVMVTDSGQAKVLDFGLAKLLDDDTAKNEGIHRTELTEVGVPYGTATYAAPEQAKGDRVDHRADIFSTGVLLYEMLTGTWPFHGKTSVEVRYAVMTAEPKPLAQARPGPLHPRLQEIINRAMAKEPNARYQKVTELRDDLRKVMQELTGSTGELMAPVVPKHVGGGNAVKRAMNWIRGRREVDSQGASRATGSLFTSKVDASVSPQQTSIGDEKKSVVILPFKNLSHDEASKFYEFSLADAVITELAKVRSLVVRPSSVIAKYQGSEQDPREIGRDLGTSAVMSASFLRGGDRIRVTAQLLDVNSGDILWSDKIDADAGDIITLQDMITQRIVDGLKIELSPAESARLAQRPTENVEAYEEYLRGRDNFGRFIFRSLELKDSNAAIENFNRAIELDPNFAQAYSGLGASYANRVFKGLGDADDYTQAEAAFCHAIQLDPDIVEARVLMVFIYLSRGEKQKARASVARLQQEAPNDGSLHFVKATLSRLDGQYDRALESWERLGRLDPAARVVASYNRARIFMYQGRYDDAMLELERGSTIEPDHPLLRVFRSRVLYYQGRLAEATTLLEDVLEKNPELFGVRPILASFLIAAGHNGLALDQLTPRVLEIARADHDMAYWTASAYAMLGEKDTAFEWLERSVALGNENVHWFQADRNLATLQDDPRFHGLLQQIAEQNERLDELRLHFTQRPEDTATGHSAGQHSSMQAAKAAAYEEYLRGRDAHGQFIYHTMSLVDSDDAIAHFRRALELDPTFTLAHCALGAAHVNRVIKYYGTVSDYARAAAEFEIALKSESKQLEARLNMVFVHLARGEKDRANELVSALLQDNPNDSGVHYVNATVQRLRGEYDQALVSLNRMLRLNSMERGLVAYNRSRIFMYQGRNDDASMELEVAGATEPNYPLLKVFRAVLCLRSSDYAAARSSLESVLEHHPEMHGVRALYAITLWANGDTQGARDQLDERVEACANADADMAYWMAAAKAVTEDHEAAFHWLARSVEMGNENRRWIDIDPVWDGCRDDERFLAALAGTAASSSAATSPAGD